MMNFPRSWPIVYRPIVLLAVILNVIGFANGDNPVVQTIYTADPAPLVHNDRVYLFTGHDEGETYNIMRDWRLFSSADMVNWQDHGSPMSLATFTWAKEQAWAGQVIARNGKFYFYVPMRSKSPNSMAIGVGVSDSITGPFRDALGRPLVQNDNIDPSVFLDDDGQAYLYWGNPDLFYVKLNEDMISYSGGPIKVEVTEAGFGTRPDNPQRPTSYEEAPWIYKRKGIYYLIFAGICCPEDLRYATGPSVVGPWTYRGIIMPVQGNPVASSNHPGLIEFNNTSYLFYHNAALPGGGDHRRSVAVEGFVYNSDGSIPNIQMSAEGPPQIGTMNPYVRQEAETMAWSVGVQTEVCSEGGIDVALINNGDYIKVKGVAFETGAKSFSARVASAHGGGRIEVRLESVTGRLIGICDVPGTGGWQTWVTVKCPVSGATGTQDLFFRFIGEGSDFLFNFDWWEFEKGS